MPRCDHIQRSVAVVGRVIRVIRVRKSVVAGFRSFYMGSLVPLGLRSDYMWMQLVLSRSEI